jgi:opacity protein-like surface antigen
MKKISRLVILYIASICYIHAQDFIDEATGGKSGFYVAGTVTAVKMDVDHNIDGNNDTIMTPFDWEYFQSSFSMSEDDDDVGGTVFIGYNISDNQAVELSFGFSEWGATERVSAIGSGIGTVVYPNLFFPIINDSIVVHHEMKVMPLMLNYKYTHNFNEQFSLHGGIGAGIVFGSYKQNGTFTDNVNGFTRTTSASESDQTFAGQLMLGAEYHITEQVSVRGGYRLMKTGEMEFGMTNPEPLYTDPKVTVELTSHYFDGGVQFNF